jgi:D-alanyl-D-alanine carboxypeptidase/D-alanyl-D-alanine-endopeptidase (penicillin-binding protein 4)
MAPLVALLCALSVLPAAAAPLPALDEAARLKALRRCIDVQLLGRGRRWGVMIKDAESGAVLYDHNASLPFNPASNVKLVTSAAALRGLGPHFRFVTELYGHVDRGRVRRGLYLRGSGDPTLATADLAGMVTQLRRLGVKTVEGPLYLDTSYYKGATDPPGYRRFRSSHPFRAGVDALTLNHNVVRITITPNIKVGARARVELEPSSPYFKLRALVRTGARRSRLRVVTHSKGRWTGVSVTGRIPRAGRPRRYWRRVFQPARYTGQTLFKQLEAAGIRVVKKRVLRFTRVPLGVPRLVVHRSRPLVTIIRSGNKWSSNVIAEHLLLALGAQAFGLPATYAKGRRALGRHLRQLGLPARSRIENGSGLSRRSRMRPADLVAVLEGIHRDFAHGPEINASLPLAGQDGTLRRRFWRTPVQGVMRAKTGTLSGIQSLSGFVGKGPRLLVFSFLSAGVRRFARARRMQIGMSRCMVRYLD